MNNIEKKNYNKRLAFNVSNKIFIFMCMCVCFCFGFYVDYKI